MSQSVSPVRLQKELMQSAAAAAALSHRSTAKQIEYWATLGQRITKVLDTESLLAIHSGLAQLKVETIKASAINPENVFEALEKDRASEMLAQSVSLSPYRYQASQIHPSHLEQIDAEGNISIGQFIDGHFMIDPAIK